MIVCVTAVRGAPGATTWSLLLAGAWPRQLAAERVVLEADPAGGVLGARYGLGVEPGVVSLVAAMRRGGEVPAGDHGRLIGEGVWVVTGPETGEEAQRIWAGVSAPVAQALAGDGRVWVVDAGRVPAAGLQSVFVSEAAVTVLVAGGRDEDLVQVPARVASLVDLGGVPVVLIVGRCGHERRDVAAFCGAPVVGMVRSEPAALALAAAAVGGGRARRSWLWRESLTVADAVAGVAVREGHAGAELHLVEGEHT